MKDKVLNVANFIKKHDNIFCIILFFLSVYGITLNVYITNSDELWNFQNVFKFYNGFKLYKDINIIITPLFLWIGKLIFQILEPNFLTFRIYNMIIMTALYFTAYLLLKEFKISKKLAIITVIFTILSTNYIIILAQANYNQMVSIFYLLGVVFAMRNYKHNAIIQGFILFLIFMTKQNIAVLYGIALFVSTIISKNDIKKKIKDLVIEFSIFLLFTILLFVYFYKAGILYDFFSMAVLGVKEFAMKNISVNIWYVIIILLFILINIIMTAVFIKYKKVNDDEKRKLILCNCFSFMMVFMAFPIINKVHVIAGTYLSVLLTVCQLRILYREIGIKFKIVEKAMPLICILLSAYAVYHSTQRFFDWKYEITGGWYNIKREDAFFGGVIKPNDKFSIDLITKYMNNNEYNVIVLSDRAAFYMIPTKRNNGIMDLPFRGNLGKDGEEGLLEKIKSLNNSVVLIVKSESDMQWQESKMVRRYIMDNMEKIGEISYFYIYK